MVCKALSNADQESPNFKNDGDALVTVPMPGAVKISATFAELEEICYHSNIPCASVYLLKAKHGIEDELAKWRTRQALLTEMTKRAK